MIPYPRTQRRNAGLSCYELQSAIFNDAAGASLRALPASLLLLSSLLVYWPVYFHEFLLAWDDQWVVQNAYTEDGLNFTNLWKIISEFYHGQYAPTNELYYALLYWASGYNAVVFHLGSLFLHMCCIILVYSFLLKLLSMSGSFSTRSYQRIAFFTALLFGIHPFLVESVAWLSASKTIIYSLFYLLALHSWLAYLRRRKWASYVATVVLFFISFGGKEQAVVLPCCLLLLDYVTGRSLKEKAVWLEVIPFFVLAAFFGYVTLLSQAVNGDGVLSHRVGYPVYQNIVFGFYTMTEYFIKCILPIRLSYVYPFPNLPNDPLPVRFWIYPFAVIFAGVGLWSVWKQKWIFFGVAFFLIHIAVALNFIPTARFAIVADRYVYLASIGILFLVMYLVDKAVVMGIKYGRVLSAIGFCYIFGLGIYSHERVKVWHDPDTLKREIRETIRQRNDYGQHSDE
jgi:hypothetical protein